MALLQFQQSLNKKETRPQYHNFYLKHDNKNIRAATKLADRDKSKDEKK